MPESAEKPSLPPAPSKFALRGTVNMNLTPQLALQTGLPAELKITIDSTAHAEVIRSEPLTSHHDATLRLKITDGSGDRKYLDVDLHVEGDSAGTPDEGLASAIGRFLSAGQLVAQPLSQSPTTRP